MKWLRNKLIWIKLVSNTRYSHKNIHNINHYEQKKITLETKMGKPTSNGGLNISFQQSMVHTTLGSLCLFLSWKNTHLEW